MTEATQPFVSAAPWRGARAATRVVQIGAIAVVLAATTQRMFDLDRFFVPKELVLHLTALLAGLLAIGALRRLARTRADVLLAAYLLLSALSALLATNEWLAMRALALSASSIALFWIARALRADGLERPLLNALAFAVVLACVTSLLQAYGVRLDLFSVNRAPGGTLGNRNFVAHAAAFGFPLVLLVLFRARRGGVFFSSLGIAVVTAALVLTRSRGAWLAFAAMAAVFIVAILASAPLRRSGRVWRRLAVAIVMIGAGVAAALLIPNTLRWRSDNPYLDSIRDVANYEEGSGRGRLIQYERSLLMAASSPLFGTGPGNWSVEYPEHALRNDPSMDPSAGGTTFNPWPSSDWVAFLSERGLPAFAALLTAFVFIAVSGIRRLRTRVEGDVETLPQLDDAALVASVVAAVVAGAFDAVLLLPLPALLVWTAIGALWTSSGTRGASIVVVLLVVALAALGAVRSGAQLVAMEIFATGSDRASLARAARIDPGNYRLRLRLARMGKRKERCEHALAARGMFPSATAARTAAEPCLP